jgi:hypothetical protein
MIMPIPSLIPDAASRVHAGRNPGQVPSSAVHDFLPGGAADGFSPVTRHTGNGDGQPLSLSDPTGRGQSGVDQAASRAVLFGLSQGDDAVCR